MPRGMKRTKEERIADINEKLKKHNEDIKALEAEKLQLETEVKAEKFEVLQRIIDDSGKTPAEIIEILSQYKVPSAAEE